VLPADGKGQSCFRRRGRSSEPGSCRPVCPSSPRLGTGPWQGAGQSTPGSSHWVALLELKPCPCPEGRLGPRAVAAGWSSLGLQRLGIVPGSTQRCTAAAPGCSFLSKRERKSISAKSRLGLCLKPLSKELCLNVIAPLLLQGENTLYCSLFLGRLS